MCNAWNHSALCRCGFGGEGHLGRSPGGYFGGYDLRTPAGRARVYTDSHVDPNARCPVCDAHVFFYQSPYGGRVYFDALGWPWPKHPCTDSRSSAPLKAGDKDRLNNLSYLLRKLRLPTAMAPSSTPASPPALPVASNPSANPDLNNLLKSGEQALTGGSYDLARDCYVRALQLEPDSVTAWIGLTDVIERKGTTAERVFCLQRIRHLAVAQGCHEMAAMATRRLKGLHNVEAKRPAILKGIDLKLPPPPSGPSKPAGPHRRREQVG